MKHQTPWDAPEPADDLTSPSLEAQCVNSADEVAYNNHDLDDGYDAQIFSISDLRTVAIWQIAEKNAQKLYTTLSERELKNMAISYLIGWQIRDIHAETERRIQGLGIKTLTDVYHCQARLVDYSSEMSELNSQMRHFLWQRFYRHPRVAQMNFKALDIIKTLYNYYQENFEQVRLSLGHISGTAPKERLIGDYIAGMTDNYAQSEYLRIKASTDK